MSGHGINATADIHIEGGVAIGATINAGGLGYQVGDILAPITVGTGLGEGIKVSISTIHGNNELTISNVQGTFGTGAGQILDYVNASGITTIFNFDADGSGMVPTSPINVITSGDILKVNQRNHGMYSNTNRVVIRDVASTLPATNLAAAYPRTATTNISVGTTAHLMNFEGVGVAVTNTGYVRIGDEIIQYTGVSGAVLTGITRGIDNTGVANHNENQRVSKYEFNGVSLRRINKTHNMNEVTASNPYDADFYKIKINMALNGTNRTTSTIGQRFFEKDTIGLSLIHI